MPEQPKLNPEQPNELFKNFFVTADALIPGMDTIGLQGIHIDIQPVEQQDTWSIKEGHQFKRDFSSRESAGDAAQSNSFIGLFPFEKLRQDPELCERLKNQIIIDIGAGRTPICYLKMLDFNPKGYIAVEPYFAEDLLKNFEALGRKKEDYTEMSPPLPSLSEMFDHIILGKELPTKKEGPLVEHITDQEAHRFAGAVESSESTTKSGKKLIPFSIAQEDILSFLKRLPDNSVSLFASGIDAHIMGTYHGEIYSDQERYKKNLEYVDALNKEFYRVLDPQGVFIMKKQDLADETVLTPRNEDGISLEWHEEHNGLRYMYKAEQGAKA